VSNSDPRLTLSREDSLLRIQTAHWLSGELNGLKKVLPGVTAEVLADIAARKLQVVVVSAVANRDGQPAAKTARGTKKAGAPAAGLSEEAENGEGGQKKAERRKSLVQSARPNPTPGTALPNVKRFDNMLRGARNNVPAADAYGAEDDLLLPVMSTLVRRDSLFAGSRRSHHSTWDEDYKDYHNSHSHRASREKAGEHDARATANALHELGNHLLAEGKYEEAADVFAVAAEGLENGHVAMN
jgi:hypothetical protein